MNSNLPTYNAWRTALSLVVSLAVAGCAGAPQRPQNVARGDYDNVAAYASQLIRHEMDSNAVTGLSIALVDDQRVVWAAGFGYADKARKQAASAQTIYRAGSISKLFTATAAMQLAEQHKLHLDRPLHDALPEFSVRTRFGATAPITPRNLMTHHAGLPRDIAKGMFTANPAPFTEVVQQVKGSAVAYPPNLVFS